MARLARNLLPGLGVFAATLLTYRPAWRAEFIWNDADYVTAPALRSTDGLWRIWFEVGATEQYYPLLHSAFWVQHKLWGDAPTGYHLLNIGLHAACACLLAAIVLRVLALREARPGGGRAGADAAAEGVRWRAAWLAAFVFALHPVYVESVAWISEQKNTLSLLFYLLAALAYLRFDAAREEAAGGERRGISAAAWLLPWRSRAGARYWLATALFVLALLSKSTTAVLPPALLVVFWWRRGALAWQRDVVPLLPWFALGAAMGLFSAYVERTYIGAQGAEFALTGLQRALLAGRVVWFYLGKLLWPAELVFIYPRWQIDPGQAWQWLFPLAALALVAGLWAIRRRSRAPLAAALFFGGSLFPVLGFFNVYAFLFSFVADHWQYLPSIGIVVFVSAALARQLEGRGAAVRAGVPVLLLGALALLSFQQSKMYADVRTFYRATVQRNPDAWMAHNNLGNLLRADGRLAEAIGHFQAALRVRPDLEKVHNNLASCLRDLRRPQEALVHYRRALELRPDYGEAHNNLGRLLRELGQPQEALTHLLQAVRLDPDSADARNNLGMALRDLGRLPDALREFERAIRANPAMAPAHLNLALTLSLLGRGEEAMRHYEEARRLNPRIPPLPGL